MSLRDIEYAVAVGSERNFSRAAELTGVSQAALSEQIRKLESTLGFALFERTKRRVQVTPRGAEFLPRFAALLRTAADLMRDARRSAAPLCGDLRLGVIPTLGPYYVPMILAASREQFPEMNWHLREAPTADLLRRLSAGDLDAALLALPIDGDEYHVAPLFFEPFRFACPSSHPLAASESLKVADLDTAQLLFMEDGHCLREQTLDICGLRRLPTQGRFAASLEMMRYMVAADEGTALFPFLASQDNMSMNGLISYRGFQAEKVGRTIALVSRRTESRAADLAAIGSFLRQTIPDGLEAVNNSASAERASSALHPCTLPLDAPTLGHRKRV